MKIKGKEVFVIFEREDVDDVDASNENGQPFVGSLDKCKEIGRSSGRPYFIAELGRVHEYKTRTVMDELEFVDEVEEEEIPAPDPR